MRVFAALIFVACTFGCTTLPQVHPWVHTAGERTPAMVGSRGVLTPQRAAKVLARLAGPGGSDLLTKHVLIEEEASGAPLTLGNAATLLYDGPAAYRSMFEAIEGARDHVNIEFYIIEDDEVGRAFSDLLLRKAAQGVSVNLMYDSVGCIDTPPAFFERLRAGGVKVVEYNPVNPLNARGAWRINNRNHRKVVIVDGRVGFAGGINISSVYSSGSSPGSSRGSGGGSGFSRGRGMSRGSQAIGWRDTHVRIEGPAIAQVQRLFLDTWAKQRGEPLPERAWFPATPRAGDLPVRFVASGPDNPVPAIYVSLVSAIMNAEKSVHITMAYFVPDPQTIEALTGAATRGVDVKLILPSYTDFWAVFHAGRSHYSELLEAGVQIYERQQALLHAKTVVVDGVWSTIGSANMDWRSYLHNEELNAVILGPGFGKQMEATFERDRAESVPIEREAWEKRPLSVRMKEWSARVWEYWL